MLPLRYGRTFPRGALRLSPFLRPLSAWLMKRKASSQLLHRRKVSNASFHSRMLSYRLVEAARAAHIRVDPDMHPVHRVLMNWKDAADCETAPSSTVDYITDLRDHAVLREESRQATLLAAHESFALFRELVEAGLGFDARVFAPFCAAGNVRAICFLLRAGLKPDVACLYDAICNNRVGVLEVVVPVVSLSSAVLPLVASAVNAGHSDALKSLLGLLDDRAIMGDTFFGVSGMDELRLQALKYAVRCKSSACIWSSERLDWLLNSIKQPTADHVLQVVMKGEDDVVQLLLRNSWPPSYGVFGVPAHSRSNILVAASHVVNHLDEADEEVQRLLESERRQPSGRLLEGISKLRCDSAEEAAAVRRTTRALWRLGCLERGSPLRHLYQPHVSRHVGLWSIVQQAFRSRDPALRAAGRG